MNAKVRPVSLVIVAMALVIIFASVMKDMKETIVILI